MFTKSKNIMKNYPEIKHPKTEDILGFNPSVDKSIEKIEKAIDFHSNNEYPGKIPNLTVDGINGSLNKALSKKFGFTLDKSELKIVHRQVNSIKRSKGLSF